MKYLKGFNESQITDRTYIGKVERDGKITVFNNNYNKYNGATLEYLYKDLESPLSQGERRISMGYNPSTGSNQAIIGYDLNGNIEFTWVNDQTDEKTTEFLEEVRSYTLGDFMEYLKELNDDDYVSIYF